MPTGRAAPPGRAPGRGCGGEVVDAVSKVGGGALPLLELAGPPSRCRRRRRPDALARRCATGEPPVVGRVEDGRVLLDPRTLTDAEADLAPPRGVPRARGV
jgi:L-seryl-tRNA(Ser) seleniumtransferase